MINNNEIMNIDLWLLTQQALQAELVAGLESGTPISAATVFDRLEEKYRQAMEKPLG